ncbi:PqqD family protein [Salinibacter grassmerensis]|uniref:PqqD family protein n=1 Tax=Salinibacter grassmerensis TaxID=3040353 RepID=UPI0021E7A7E5|nr:PqqD family protein [Salinibacter grassmerensis]
MESTMIDESSVIVAAEHQTSAEVDGESVILDLEEGIYYGLNPVGARVWDQVQEPATVEEIVAAITAEYDVDSERCLKDVLSLLRDLKEDDLIEIKE